MAKAPMTSLAEVEMSSAAKATAKPLSELATEEVFLDAINTFDLIQTTRLTETSGKVAEQLRRLYDNAKIGKAESLLYVSAYACLLRKSKKESEFARAIKKAYEILEEIEMDYDNKGMFFLIYGVWLEDVRARGWRIEFDKAESMTFNTEAITPEMWALFNAAEPRTREYRLT